MQPSTLNNRRPTDGLLKNLSHYLVTNELYETPSEKNTPIGRIPRQPNAVSSIRIPQQLLLCRVTNNENGYALLDNEITNINEIWIKNVIILGLDNEEPFVFIDFTNRNSRSIRLTNKTAGHVKDELFLLPQTSSSLNIVYEPSTMVHLANYKDPVNLRHIQCKLLNKNGEEINYEEMFITFLIVTEQWQ